MLINGYFHAEFIILKWISITPPVAACQPDNVRPCETSLMSVFGSMLALVLATHEAESRKYFVIFIFIAWMSKTFKKVLMGLQFSNFNLENRNLNFLFHLSTPPHSPFFSVGADLAGFGRSRDVLKCCKLQLMWYDSVYPCPTLLNLPIFPFLAFHELRQPENSQLEDWTIFLFSQSKRQAQLMNTGPKEKVLCFDKTFRKSPRYCPMYCWRQKDYILGCKE